MTVGNAGPPVTGRTEENIEEIKDIMENCPSTSIRRVAQQVGLSVGTTWTILRRDLHYFPYKIQLQQQLKNVDVTRQENFGNLMVEMIESRQIDINKIWFSDEAHFHLSGYVNKQNWRHWGSENPHLAIATPAHPKRVTVWCAMSSAIIGPIFIEGNVTSQKYQELLERNFLPQIRRRHLVQDYWFQQDGAGPHRTVDVLQSLSTMFNGHIIGLDCDRVTDSGLEWPPYSPDVNPCDYFLWGHIKDRVYRTSPATLEDLKIAITQEVTAIGSEVLKRVIQNFESRVYNLVVSKGKHFENLIH